MAKIIQVTVNDDQVALWISDKLRDVGLWRIDAKRLPDKSMSMTFQQGLG